MKVKNKDDGKEKGDEQKEPIDQDELKSLEKKLSAYYSKVLFYAF